MRNALILAAALVAAPVAAMAEGISYSYLDARYFSTDSDAMSINYRGGQLDGSLALGSLFYVAGGGQYAETEKFRTGTSSGKFQLAAGSARVGVHYPLTTTLDIVAEGGGLYNRVKGKGGAAAAGRDDDFGYLAQAGLRLALIPQVEVGAFYGYQDIFDESQSAFTGDLQWHFSNQFSLVGSATNARSYDIYTVGARFRF